MTTLYACIGSGNCFKPWLVLNQLKKRFDLQLVDVLSGEQKSHSFLKINPLGVVPYLKSDCGKSIGESNAMLWFLSEGTHLAPPTATERAASLQWMFFEQSKLEPFISPARFYSTILPDTSEERAGQIYEWQQSATMALYRLDAYLENRKFMLDSGYGITDIAIFGYVHVLEEAGIPMNEFPAIGAWINEVSNTDGFIPLRELGQANIKAA